MKTTSSNNTEWLQLVEGPLLTGFTIGQFQAQLMPLVSLVVRGNSDQ